jgi:hypothetical protein
MERTLDGLCQVRMAKLNKIQNHRRRWGEWMTRSRSKGPIVARHCAQRPFKIWNLALHCEPKGAAIGATWPRPIGALCREINPERSGLGQGLNKGHDSAPSRRFDLLLDPGP